MEIFFFLVRNWLVWPIFLGSYSSLRGDLPTESKLRTRLVSSWLLQDPATESARACHLVSQPTYCPETTCKKVLTT